MLVGLAQDVHGDVLVKYGMNDASSKAKFGKLGSTRKDAFAGTLAGTERMYGRA